MKRKIAVALVSIALVGGALCCFTNAQDPAGIGPAQSKLTTTGQGKVNGTRDLIRLHLAQKESATQGNIAMLLNQLKSAEGGEKENLIDNIKAAVGETGSLTSNRSACPQADMLHRDDSILYDVRLRTAGPT